MMTKHCFQTAVKVMAELCGSRLWCPSPRQLAVCYLNSRHIKLMPHFSDVGLFVSVDVGKAGLYVCQHPLPFVVDRPYNETVIIIVAEYILVLKKAYKIFAVAKYAAVLEYKAKCLLYSCLFHIEQIKKSADIFYACTFKYLITYFTSSKSASCTSWAFWLLPCACC